jgi:magnesium transporter
MATPIPGQTTAAEPKTIRAGEPVARRRAPASTATPGALRVSAMVGGSLQEAHGEEALKRLPGFLREPEASVWIDMSGPSQAQVEQVGAALSLHPLIVEDVMEGNQRAKLEMTDGVVHLVLFHLQYEDKVVALELDMVLGLGYLLTVHGEGWDPHASGHLRDGTQAVLMHGPDHLLWALCDDIVDGYFPFSDELGNAIDEVQDEVMRAATPQVLERVFELKRQLIEVRRSISPVREVFNQLTNRDMPLIDEDEIVYFRDVYDHLIRLTDELDMYRELASATLDVYLTQVNNNLSVIMKRLTGVTVILAGIGAVAGLFGMSEAGAAVGGAEAGGFWVVTGAVAAAAAVALAFLRKIDWI